MEMRVKMKNRSHRYDIIELHQDMITNILNKVPRYDDGYMY